MMQTNAPARQAREILTPSCDFSRWLLAWGGACGSPRLAPRIIDSVHVLTFHPALITPEGADMSVG